MTGILSEVAALDTGRPVLRRFGVVVGGVFLLIAAVVSWRLGWSTGFAVRLTGAVGGILVVGGLLAPGLLRLPYRVWMTIALALGFVMTRILLTIVFYLIVTPIGVVRRLMGKDPLARRPDPDLPTYWITRSDDAADPARFEKYW